MQEGRMLHGPAFGGSQSRGRTMLTTRLAQPLTLRPQLDAKPWGGRRLAEWGIALPPHERIGEALLTAPEATVVSGDFAGASLGELARLAPETWIGARGLEATGGRKLFPLLSKLLDAQTDLSIQVHPDDRAATAAGLGTGKTETYHILAAEPDSVIYLGLAPEVKEEDFATACLRGDGTAAQLLRRLAVTPGMTILIPAGTVHAPGAGIVLYEIQQPSNVTYRLDDWGRVDAGGNPRALHHAEGLPLVDPSSRPEPIAPIPLADGSATRTLLVATRYFALERIVPAAGKRLQLAAVASPQVLTCLAGTGVIETSGEPIMVTMGETVVVPVGMATGLSADEGAVLLRAWVPDLAREVIDPARAAGAPESTIHQLGLSVGQPVTPGVDESGELD
jgi:mannose-6-phosphate isomerase